MNGTWKTTEGPASPIIQKNLNATLLAIEKSCQEHNARIERAERMLRWVDSEEGLVAERAKYGYERAERRAWAAFIWCCRVNGDRMKLHPRPAYGRV